MKTNLILFLFLTCFANLTFSQSDTTKFNMKNKKILIINEKENQQAKQEFKRKMLEIQDSISLLTALHDSVLSTDEKRADFEKKKNTLIKQLEAYKKGLDVIVDEKNDNEKMDFDNDGNKKDSKCKKNPSADKFKGHWNGISFGVNVLIDKSGSTNLPNGKNGEADASFLDQNVAKSVSTSLDLFQASIPLIGKRFGLITGLGFQYQDYSLSKNYTLAENADGQLIGELNPVHNYSKNQLTTWFMQVPIMLEINTDKGLFFNAGVLLGMRIYSSQEQKYEDKGKNYSLVTSSDFNLNPFRIVPTASIGYKHISLFGQYQMSKMFKDNKGPEVYPFTVGLKLVF